MNNKIKKISRRIFNNKVINKYNYKVQRIFCPNKFLFFTKLITNNIKNLKKQVLAASVCSNII